MKHTIDTGHDVLDPGVTGGRVRMRRAVAAGIGVVIVLGLLVSPGGAQYPADARLAEAKQLAGAVLRALERCVQARGAGASCRLGEVAAQAGVNPATGASPNGRWTVVPATSLTLSSGTPSARTGGEPC